MTKSFSNCIHKLNSLVPAGVSQCQPLAFQALCPSLCVTLFALYTMRHAPRSKRHALRPILKPISVTFLARFDFQHIGKYKQYQCP